MSSINYMATSYNGNQTPGERNDCAVRALMTTAGCTYSAAHTVLRARCARRNGRGTRQNKTKIPRVF